MKRLLLALLLTSVGLAACETTGGGSSGPTPPPPPVTDAFRAQDFAWSTPTGANRIDGALALRVSNVRYSCTGSAVILVPETAWSRRRMTTLYGSPTGATVAVDVVRARTPPAPPEFGTYVRSTPCAADHFTFTGLADGAWFVITQARATVGTGAQMAIMRRVETRGGRPTTVNLGG